MLSTNNLSTFKPTYLYIKQHSVTGKLYFGKTTRDLKYLLNGYKGGGKQWNRHIKKHGEEHVITLWYELFTDRDSLVSFALQFSKEMKIVESASWLNLIDENGLDGAPVGVIQTEEHKRKNHLSHIGKSKGPKTEQTLHKLRLTRSLQVCLPHTNEAKKNIRQSNKMTWSDDNKKKEHSILMKQIQSEFKELKNKYIIDSNYEGKRGMISRKQIQEFYKNHA